MIIDFLADYFQNIENYPVRSQVNPGYLLESLPDHAPMQPESIETILKDVHRNIIPGITHWQSPNFFAPLARRRACLALSGDEMLLNGLVFFQSLFHSQATVVVVFCIARVCEAFVCTLLAAKEKILDQIGRDYAEKLVVYCSDQTHFSFQKSVKIVVLVGTTSTTAVDPLGPLTEVASAYNMWVHVDAAYAGSACICPEFRHFLNDTSLWFVSEFVPIGKKYDYDPEANEFNEKLLESVNATGCAYMTHSVVGGVYFIRFAVGATLTEDRHVAMAWELVKNQATSMLYTPTPKL
ncbi:tyrosine decarboxylase 1-like protein [Tanacetum coccineum]